MASTAGRKEALLKLAMRSNLSVYQVVATHSSTALYVSKRISGRVELQLSTLFMKRQA